MSKQEDKKARLPYLITSFVINLGLLFAFKYFNFFNSSLSMAFNQFNIFYDVPSFQVLLPVGISFYTFQTLSYSFDVYRGRKKAEDHFGYFALYVSFFPQLVAGPIERSTRLLPQLKREHNVDFERIKEGLLMMGWGFFRKIVIADNLAIFIDEIFSHDQDFGGLAILLAAYLFVFQVYLDFAAYSEIAIGASQVMGIKLMTNFKRPMLAGSISELWQRWHISLITWFRDYVLLPLSKKQSKDSVIRKSFNILFIFFLSGLWHGAAWTFVLWGTLNGVWLVLENQTHKIQKKFYDTFFSEKLTWLKNFIRAFCTVTIFSIISILFRARNLEQGFSMMAKTLDPTSYSLDFFANNQNIVIFSILVLVTLMIFEYFEEQSSFFEIIYKATPAFRWLIYTAIIITTIYFIPNTPEKFIYFQF